MRRKKDNASIMDGWGFIHRLQSKKERKKEAKAGPKLERCSQGQVW